MFAGSFLALAGGVLDDKYDLSPYLRFVLNLFSAIIIVAGGISVPFVTNPFGGTFQLNSFVLPLQFLNFDFIISLSDVIAVIWFVWVMNMLNWSKGVDGQMPGIIAISAIVIGILSFRFPIITPTDIISAKLSFILAGGALGFLIYNFYPARIFPGYGATSIYLLLAAISILSSVKLVNYSGNGVPLIDGVITILRRILSGKSPFGMIKTSSSFAASPGIWTKKVALFYWTISAILGSFRFLSSRGKLLL